jgi:Zn-dependent peptidase ImmA (M78 family)
LRFPDPEQTATEVIGKAGISAPPVDLESVVSLWPGLRITEEDLDREAYLIDFGKQGGEIVVKAKDTLQRRRYSIAHELGHWVLRDTTRNSGELAKSIGSLNCARSVIEEKWCDRFAAALLMPQAWLIEELKNARVGGLLEVLLSSPSIYHVSETAFMLRVSELTRVSSFYVKQWDGQVFVEHQYVAKKVKTKNLFRTLDEVLPVLSDSETPIKLVHEKTQMLSVHKLRSNDSGKRKWTVCILPKLISQSDVSH